MPTCHLSRSRSLIFVVLAATALSGCAASVQRIVSKPARSTGSAISTRAETPEGVASADLSGDVSLDNAWKVTQKIWMMRENARTNDKAAALRLIDTGVERERDLGVTLDAYGIGDWSARVRRTFGPTIYVVPHQRRFPQSYLAAVQTSTTYATTPNDHAPQNLGAVALLVLTKAGPRARWRVAMESGGTGSIQQLPNWHHAFDGSSDPHPGYSASAPQPSWIRPADAIADLARFYQHYANYGTRPSHSMFVPGNWTTVQGKQLSTDPKTGKTLLNGQVVSFGYRQTLHYFVDRADPVFHFDFGGADLICGTVRGTALDTPVGNGYLSQNAHRTNWGGWLAPGDYSSITTLFFHQVCMRIPPTGAQKIQVITGDDTVSDWTATGHRTSRLRSFLDAIA